MPAIVNLLFNAVSTHTMISFSVVLPMVSLLALLLGVGGHLLLWLVLVRNPRSRSRPSSVLLLSLSLADLGVLLAVPCALLSASFQKWRLGGGTCVLLGFMTSVTVGVEIFSLAALAVLRFRIVTPRTRPAASLVQVLCVVLAIWLVSVTMALPKVTYIDFDGTCTWSVSREERLYFLVPAFLVYYVGPLFCIAINCGLIIRHLHRCRGSLAADRRNRKATVLLIASTLVFAISWLPYYSLEFINFTSLPVKSHHMSTLPPTYLFEMSDVPVVEAEEGVSLLWEVASLAAIILVCLAPCWNPPLYFLLSRPAVRQLRALLPSFFQKHWVKKPVQRWRIAPAPPPYLPNLQPPADSVTRQTVTQGLMQ